MDLKDLSIASVVVGFFILFSLLFNGGLDDSLLNSLAVLSGITFMLAGTTYLLSEKKLPTFILLIVTGLAYPFIIPHRFSPSFNDWAGFEFDVAFMLLVAYMLLKFKPDKFFS